jgi:hypothetical protein
MTTLKCKTLKFHQKRKIIMRIRISMLAFTSTTNIFYIRRDRSFSSFRYTPEQLSFFSFLNYHHILHDDPSGLSYKDKINGILSKSKKTHNEDFQIWLEDNKIFLKYNWRVVRNIFLSNSLYFYLSGKTLSRPLSSQLLEPSNQLESRRIPSQICSIR